MESRTGQSLDTALIKSVGSYVHNSIIFNDWDGSDSLICFGEGQAHDKQAALSSPI